MKRLLPLLTVLLFIAWLAAGLAPAPKHTRFDLDRFARLPVLVNGRIKPIDSVARNALLVLQGRQTVKDSDGRKLQPVEWLLELTEIPAKAEARRIFEITNPEVLALLRLDTKDGDGGKRFSFSQIQARTAEIDRQARLADQVPSGARSAFQRAVLQLYVNLDTYQRLRYSLKPRETADLLGELQLFSESIIPGIEALRASDEGKPFDEAAKKRLLEFANKWGFFGQESTLLAIPPAPGSPPDNWRTIGNAVQETFDTGSISPDVLAYAGLLATWREQKPEEFNEILGLYTAQVAKSQTSSLIKCQVEVLFNRLEPFYKASVIYLFAFLAAVLSWVFGGDYLRRTGTGLMWLAFLLSTAGILTRMWLESRPPVTNLYSSALFVGWIAVALCLFIEARFRNAIGTMAAGIIGGCTLLIAHYLSLGGDTMEMMRAVLDSNFWLATHVVTISIGYGATYLAGVVALLYVLLGVLTPRLDRGNADTLARIVYGIVCFATFFSLVGTVLGGIWADQSWGRFWGWDPKENGALLIVIWNAIILHSRWGGLVRQRGLMALALFGNIVTSWSWFGTNMLGVGLHSYGFNDKGAVWLGLFILLNLAFILLTRLPENKWRSRLS